MKFSVILPSYLGEYTRAASNREAKLIRAIDSVLNQSFKDFEVIVVADGCQKTFDLVCEKYLDEEKIECFQITKQPMWSGKQRAFGISKADGEWIAYLDSDDYWGPDHLDIIENNLWDYDWVWFNDYLMDKQSRPHERQCMVKHKFQAGTANIAHKTELVVDWNGKDYGYDDWSAIQSLLRYPNYKKIETPQYYVCHLPASKIDV